MPNPTDDADDHEERRESRRRDREEDEGERPRRRRRRRDEDDEDDDGDGDEGLQYVIPINTSGLAIAAGYLGLISVLCFPAPFALLFGVLALVQLNKKQKLHGKGRAIFGIAMGAFFTLVMLVLVFLSLVG